MKILIIEDEPLVAKDLRKTLQQLEPAAEILEVLSSVDAARKWLSKNPGPDLILSDIQLSDGISFEIYEDLHLKCPIIFTTAYDDYAIRAFKLNSIDYLLKPIDREDLRAALTKYKSLTTENVLAEQLKNLLSTWGQSPQKKYKERFLTLHRNSLVPVTQEQISHFHKEELIHLYTVDNQKFISEHQTLDEVETLLNPDIFFRLNRQFIVHIQAIGKIKNTHKGLTVELKPPYHIEVDISREKATAFKKWIAQ